MKTLKQIRRQFSVHIASLVDGPDAWGTEQGATVFAEVNRQLLPLGEGTLISIDYEGLRRSDASFQREAVVETLRKHRPRLLFMALNLDDADVRSNLELALERRGDSLILRGRDGSTEVLGKRPSPELKATLDAISNHDEFTSGKLTAAPFKLEPSTASARLTALWKAGLIERVEGTAASGGKEYRYYAIE